MAQRTMTLAESDAFKQLLAEVGAPDILRRVAYQLGLRYFAEANTGMRFMRQTFDLATAIEKEPRQTT
jgi:hypothetical protein